MSRLLSSSKVHGCPEYRRVQGLSRRAALQLGLLTPLGLGLPQLLARQAAAESPGGRGPGKAKSVILLWLQGGVSHHDTLDMKPDAPEDVRGIYSPIPTNLPGVFISEKMPELARRMDKLAVIRSVTHAEGGHERGSMYMVEGKRPAGAVGTGPSGNPHLGSIVAHELGMQHGLPAHVSIPGNDFTSRFVGRGYLPAGTEAFSGVNRQSLAAQGTSRARFEERVALREMLDNLGSSRMRHGAALDAFTAQAIDVITSARAAEAFDFQTESEETLRRYGVVDAGGGRAKGQMPELCLTARRLVEAGVRFVTIGRNSWDHHSTIFPQLDSRVPRFDQAFAGLLDDLEERGLLEETLVVYLTEFGRTPKVNSQAGRDHWARVFSVAFAGAGIRTGQVIGASDRVGGEPTERPVSPEEIAATMLHLVGIDPQTDFLDSGGRPVKHVYEARPIPELLA